MALKISFGLRNEVQSGERGQVRNLGKPVELASRYFREGADEVTFLNITGFRDHPLQDLPMLEVCKIVPPQFGRAVSCLPFMLLRALEGFLLNKLFRIASEGLCSCWRCSFKLADLRVVSYARLCSSIKRFP